jgi:hypothetical protein
MKKYIHISILSLIGLVSCYKEEQPRWINVPEEQNNTRWEDSYTNGGTIPDNTSNEPTLVGTRWALVKMVAGFSTTYPNDTLEFLNNHRYGISGSNIARNYRLSIIPSSTNYELSLYYFTPFGGSHYSADVGYYFIQDGVIENVEFHNIQNTTSKIRAWFKKI